MVLAAPVRGIGPVRDPEVRGWWPAPEPAVRGWATLSSMPMLHPSVLRKGMIVRYGCRDASGAMATSGFGPGVECVEPAAELNVHRVDHCRPELIQRP